MSILSPGFKRVAGPAVAAEIVRAHALDAPVLLHALGFGTSMKMNVCGLVQSNCVTVPFMVDRVLHVEHGGRVMGNGGPWRQQRQRQQQHRLYGLMISRSSTS